MEIRPVRPQDIPQVLPMVDKIAQLHEAWDPAKYGYRAQASAMYENWLAAKTDDPRAVFLVAERESRIVAFLVGTVEKEVGIYRIKEYGFIHDLWVEENYRHEGIARQMTMLAVERFRAMGCPQVRLDTAAPNDAARGLFASCGFRPSVTEMLLEL